VITVTVAIAVMIGSASLDDPAAGREFIDNL